MSHWWVSRGSSEPVGPVTTEVLLRGIASGRVPLDTLICRVGEQRWVPLSEVDEVWEQLHPEQSRTDVNESPWFLDRQHPRTDRLADSNEEEEATRVFGVGSSSLPPPEVLALLTPTSEIPSDATTLLHRPITGESEDTPILSTKQPTGPATKAAIGLTSGARLAPRGTQAPKVSRDRRTGGETPAQLGISPLPRAPTATAAATSPKATNPSDFRHVTGGPPRPEAKALQPTVRPAGNRTESRSIRKPPIGTGIPLEPRTSPLYPSGSPAGSPRGAPISPGPSNRRPLPSIPPRPEAVPARPESKNEIPSRSSTDEPRSATGKQTPAHHASGGAAPPPVLADAEDEAITVLTPQMAAADLELEELDSDDLSADDLSSNPGAVDANGQHPNRRIKPRPAAGIPAVVVSDPKTPPSRGVEDALSSSANWTPSVVLQPDHHVTLETTQPAMRMQRQPGTVQLSVSTLVLGGLSLVLLVLLGVLLLR